MPRNPKEPCQAEACAIQKCLQDNNFQQEMCEDVINNMIKCCMQDEARVLPRCSGFANVVLEQEKK